MARNLNVPSIKIVDDVSIRNEIVELYGRKSQKQINLWSIEIIKIVLSTIEFEDTILGLINEGIEICEKWRNEFVRAHDIRQIGFKIHRIAKLETNEITSIALRTIGQAISSAHMKEHGIVASDYCVKLTNLINDNDINISSSMRKTQLKLLENT